jgi:SAM-dependent methyltransferase
VVGLSGAEHRPGPAERRSRAAERREPVAAAWHDVENGAYDADLPLWRELAAASDGPILDLGAGTGRVARHLSAAGHDVVALDSAPDLLAALSERDPHVTTVTGDARDFSLNATFGLVIAPMQLMQILGGGTGRRAVLGRAREHLAPGGSFAAAIADPREALAGDAEALPGDAEALAGDAEALPDDAPGAAGRGLLRSVTLPPLPDMLERDGWVFSSQPVSVREQSGCVVVTRRRQAVSPSGELEEEVAKIELDLVSVDELEAEARQAGFERFERREVAETSDHIGSMVIVCRL